MTLHLPRTLIIGLAGFAGASAIGGASVNFAMLVTARTVQGAFGALLAPSVLGLLTATFTDLRERGAPRGNMRALSGPAPDSIAPEPAPIPG